MKNNIKINMPWVESPLSGDCPTLTTATCPVAMTMKAATDGSESFAQLQFDCIDHIFLSSAQQILPPSTLSSIAQRVCFLKKNL